MTIWERPEEARKRVIENWEQKLEIGIEKEERNLL